MAANDKIYPSERQSSPTCSPNESSATRRLLHHEGEGLTNDPESGLYGRRGSNGGSERESECEPAVGLVDEKEGIVRHCANSRARSVVEEGAEEGGRAYKSQMHMDWKGETDEDGRSSQVLTATSSFEQIVDDARASHSVGGGEICNTSNAGNDTTPVNEVAGAGASAGATEELQTLSRTRHTHEEHSAREGEGLGARTRTSLVPSSFPLSLTKRESEDAHRGEAGKTQTRLGHRGEGHGRSKFDQSVLLITERRVRPSRLDCCDPQSSISRSEFRGLFNLCHTAGGLWMLAAPLYNWYETGEWVDRELLHSAFKDIPILMSSWAFALAYSFTAYGLFKIRQKWRVSHTIIKTIMHTNQLIFLVLMFSLVRLRDWAVFPACFCLTITFLHGMKMHSYVTSTLSFESDAIAHVRGYPQNCTLKNFATFILVPCLVYEPSYPRNPQPFRPKYFAQKLLYLLSTFLGIFMVSSAAVLPVFRDSDKPAISLSLSSGIGKQTTSPSSVSTLPQELLLSEKALSLVYNLTRMIVPLLAMDFLMFYMMFEGVLNLLAEITDFGDREFYEDWWNCTTWEEFARKWNKPVHEFLLCHVYVKALTISKRSKIVASVATFMFSAVLHELFLSVALGFVRFWMSGLMMVQIPLIMLSRYHKNTTFGNYYFWFGLCLGVPFLTVIYGREWAARQVTDSIATQATHTAHATLPLLPLSVVAPE